MKWKVQPSKTTERQVDGGGGDTEVVVEAQVADSTPDLYAGYEADINRHEVEGHQPFLEPHPCVRCDQALELDILNECLQDVESCIVDAAPRMRSAQRLSNLQNSNWTSLRMQKRREKQLLAGGHAQPQDLTKYELWSTNLLPTLPRKREEGSQRVVGETTTTTALLKRFWNATTLWATKCWTCCRKRVYSWRA